jgi:adenylosuccinate lyase
VVHPDRMQENLDATGGLVYSQRVLLALINGGLSRDDAYAIVQRAAARVWEHGDSFADAVPGEAGNRLDPAQLADLFDPRWFVRNLDGVFARLEKLEVDTSEPAPSPGPAGEA